MKYSELRSADSYVGREMEGEKKLLLRMVQVAVMDASRRTDDPQRLKRRRQAREWIFRDRKEARDADGFTFERICEHLDIEKRALRKRILRELKRREVWN